MCASCHGTSGEGTDDHYPRPLIGERSVASLAKLIAKTMPEDEPGTCVGPDAEKVSAYIYDAFYSKAAQARNPMRPARIELSRLTVRQYRNAVADLVGSFRGPASWDDRRGLKGDYARARPAAAAAAAATTASAAIDPEVRFHFGSDSPIPAQNAVKEQSPVATSRCPRCRSRSACFRQFSQEFRVSWQGSVLAPETGEYEFVVRSENAIRLWVNDNNKPLIDISVKSGSDTEYRETIYLLGGRVYPLRLELTRGKEKTSSIELLWKVPRHGARGDPAAETSRRPTRPRSSCPGRRSRPTTAASAMSAARRSPRRGTRRRPTRRSRPPITSPPTSRTWPGSPTAPARIRTRTARSGCASSALSSPSGRSGVRSLNEQRAIYIDRQLKEGGDPRTAVKKVVLLVLKSPRFLYRELGTGAPDAFDVASRLSFGLWDSIPDRPLWDAASSGRLARREQVAEQARRMAADLRARSKLREFLLQWLRVDQGAEIAKDPKAFPGFDEAVISDLRDSLELFLDDIITQQVRRLPRAAGHEVALSQRAAGAALRRGPAARRAVPARSTGRRASGRAS